MALALCLTLLPTAALAADETGTVPTYSGGSGTKDDPWQISSVADLQLLASTINEGKAAGFDADCTDTGNGIPGNYHGYYFKQTADLDLSSIASWDPIGYSGGRYFAGHYDGGGYTISNAKSTGKNDDEGYATAGIFGWVAFGSVKNLTVKNADFLATGDNNMSYAGGVLALAYSCTVENCSVYNSKIESRRDPNNSNYAGGITGIALTSSFEKCASVGNTIRHGSFGGGFIGALNRGGNSNFTNCYVANCIVTGCSDTGAMNTLSGGFQSASMGGDAILKSCFVYDCVAQPDETSKASDYFGVFTANTQYGKVVATSCFYYDVNDATVNAEGAVSKTVDEFADGTVANLLGEAFAQGKLYPVFATDPADYTAVDAAIAKANALNENDYIDFSAVQAALDAVERGKTITQQDEVDDMAKAIEEAIAALVEKPSSGDGSSSGSFFPSYPVTTPGKTENGTVTVSTKNATSGSTVTITVKPDDGFKLDELTVIDKNGNELKLTDKGNGKYTFTMPASKVEVNAAFVKEVETSPFSDVSTSAYYYKAVKWAQKKGITGGIGNGLFVPNQPCTRAQIVTFLWRAAGSPVVNYAMNMSDVPEGSYYAEAVRWALSEGITTGTTGSTFSPDETCTRAQAVAFLFRYTASEAVTLQELVSGFSDADSVPGYALSAMNWALAEEIVQGNGSKLMPNDSCTRAQIVTFLFRAYQDK